MDPRMAWPSPEQLGVANDSRTRIIEAKVSQPGTKFQQNKRNRENKASIYDLNHSSNKHFLDQNGGLTPWIPNGKEYHPSVIGYE